MPILSCYSFCSCKHSVMGSFGFPLMVEIVCLSDSVPSTAALTAFAQPITLAPTSALDGTLCSSPWLVSVTGSSGSVDSYSFCGSVSSNFSICSTTGSVSILGFPRFGLTDGVWVIAFVSLSLFEISSKLDASVRLVRFPMQLCALGRC